MLLYLQSLKKVVTSLACLLLYLLLCSSVGYATEQQRKVTLSGKDISFWNILDHIQKQTGISINHDNLKSSKLESKKYTLSFQDTELETVIKFLLKDFKDISYQINGNSLQFIFEENIRFKNDSTPSKITGFIKDNTGNAIPGATIQIKNSDKGTTTDNYGKFVLPDVGRGAKIVISSIGYQTKEILANTGNIIAELNPFINNLNETQIVAYGSTTKKYNTGNVTTIKESDLRDLPVSNPLLALQGRIPGLDINPTSGVPGAGISMRIQGVNSLINGNDPLIIIDGTPYPSQFPSSLQYLPSILGDNGGSAPGQLGSPLSFLNTSDIESVSVLKGADATSIYGSRAANGVILITTKKGKSGKLSVTVDFQAGIKKVGKKLDLMNTKQYLAMRHEGLSNNGASPSQFDYDVNGFWDTTSSHDWQKELFGRTAHNIQTSLAISGGSENTQYRLSGTFINESLVFPTYFNSPFNSQGTGNISLSTSSPNKRLTVRFNTNYTYNKKMLPSGNYVIVAMNLAPNAPNLIDNNGNINWATGASGIETWNNPLVYNLSPYKTEGSTLVSNLNFTYEILPDLKISSNLGYNNLKFTETLAKTTAALSPLLKKFSVPNQLLFQERENTIWNIEPQLTYSKKFNKHSFDFLLGTTFYRQKSTVRSMIGQKFTTDLLIEDLASAAEIIGAVSDNTLYKYNAVFGRIGYNFNRKYIIQLTGRRDGSSRFGSNNRFHSFGSVGAAWLFTEESFMKENSQVISYGKIRGSYGTTGNDQIGDYKYLTLYRSIGTARAYQGSVALTATNLSNPDLQWEEVKKWEAGLELGFFKNRLLLNLNYAINTSSNQLGEYTLPIITGFTSILKNQVAKIRNRLIEVSLTSENIKTNNFSWSTGLFLTIQKSKLTEFPNLDKSTYYSRYIVGKSPNIATVFKYAGINDTTGIFQFYDTKGGITYSPDAVTDAIVLDPEFYGGFSNTFNYKNLSLTIFFNYDKRNRLISYPLFQPGRFNNNVPTYMLDRWQKSGDQTLFQKYSADYSTTSQYVTYAALSNKSYENIFFLRCSNISLNWEMPSKWKQAMRMEQGSIYMQIANPFVITNDKYMLDPQTGNQLPALKTYNLGIRLSF